MVVYAIFLCSLVLPILFGAMVLFISPLAQWFKDLPLLVQGGTSLIIIGPLYYSWKKKKQSNSLPKNT